MGGGSTPSQDTKTVVVLGAAYGGARAAQLIAAGLPEGWKVLLIDRNSHANHVYVMPRYAVIPGHEYKAFIPYTKVFMTDPPKPEQHLHLHAHVTSIRPHHITLSKAFPELGFPTTTIAFNYAVYALGSQLPPSLNLWKNPTGEDNLVPEENGKTSALYTGMKEEGCQWFKEKQKIIKDAPTVLVVGGGALGIQFATDIKEVYPTKKVTLLHSRLRLLPRFDEKMHDEIFAACNSLSIDLILGERLDLSSIENGSAKLNKEGQKVVRTVSGREIAADLLLLCTGQAANTQLLKTMDPKTINESNGLARVLKTMQLYSPVPKAVPSSESSDNAKLIESLEKISLSESSTTYPHIFAIGDAADAFGAIPAGHNAFYQGEIAAKNILRLIKARTSDEPGEPLIEYTPGPPAIKVSLGIKNSVYQVGPSIGKKDDGVPDLQAATIWPYFGLKVEKDEDMKA